MYMMLEKIKRLVHRKLMFRPVFLRFVIDKQTGDTLAFLFPHKENQGNDLTVVQTTVQAVEAATGIVFAIPKGHNKAAKEPIWPVDFKSVAVNKRQLCKGAE